MAKKIFRYLFIIACITIFSLWLLLNSTYVQTKAKTFIQKEIFAETGYTIEIGKVSFSLPRTLILQNVSLNVAEKEIKSNLLKAEEISFKIDFLSFINNKIHFKFYVKVAETLKIHGDFRLSESKSLDGTTIHIPSTHLCDLYKIADPSFTCSPISGLFELNGLVNGTLNAPNFDLKAIFEDLIYNQNLSNNFQIPSLEGRVLGSLSSDEIKAHFSLNSLKDDDPSRIINSDFDFSYPLGQKNESGKILLKSITIVANGVDLKGFLEIDPLNPWPIGSLQAGIEDIGLLLNGPLHHLALSHLKGPLNIKALFSNKKDEELTITSKSPRLTQDDIIIKDFSLASTHSSTFNFHEFHLSIAKISKGKTSLKGLKASTTIDHHLNSWPFSIQSKKLKTDENNGFEALGSWHFGDHAFNLTVERLKAKSGSIFLSVNDAATLIFADDKITLKPLVLKGSLGTGSLDAKVAYEDERISGDVLFKLVDIANLFETNKALLPLKSVFPIQGIIGGNISINGPLNDQEVTIEVNGSDLLYGDINQKASCSLNATLENGFFSCLGTLSNSLEIPLQFNFLVPAHLSLLPLNLELSPDSPLIGNIQVAGPISPFLELANLNKIPFSGDLGIKAELYGTIETPHILGKCSLTNGFYEIPKIGVAIHDITGEIEVQDSKLLINHLEGFDGQGGTVVAKAFALINSDFPFELNMNLNNFLLLHQDKVLAICKGPLNFKGNSSKATLDGNLNLIEGQINIPERPTAVVNSVDVIYINKPENELPPQQIALKTSDWPINLEIALDIPENLSIQGKDLKSLWKGSLKIQGNQDEALLFGELKIIHGQYLFNGNPFEIGNGIITFAGDIEKKTTLYVTTTKDLDKVKVDIIAKGSINNPEISFRSNPPMPQREILSWILFNRGTNEISPFQGTQLSESITNLKTNQSGPDILTKIKSTFGIDRFEITRNSNNETDTEVDVQVGKYITKDVLVSVIKSDVNSLAVEAALSNRVKLQAQVGDDSQGKLILKWKRDY